MSDYTPTTESLRQSLCGASPVLMALFDRWLAEHNRALSEKRWDEGHNATPHVRRARNPYQEVSK